MREQLWLGLLASSHSHDGVLPLWFRSSPLSLILRGEKEVGGGGARRSVLSQGLKWDQIVGNPLLLLAV